MRFMPIALAAVVALGACGDDDVNIIDPFPRTGTFTLQSVGGNALPVVLQRTESPPLLVELVSGSLTVNANASFTSTRNLRQSLGGIVTTSSIVCIGTLSVSGNTISFVETATDPQCGGEFTGTLDGNTLATTRGGIVSIWVR